MAYEITNENDSFFFFEMIRNIEPDSILDAGLFLQRIGALSRHARDLSFPDQVVCDGMLLGDQRIFPVSKTIYNSICDVNGARSFYALASVLDVTDLIPPDAEGQLWTFLRSHCHCVIADCRQPERFRFLRQQGTVRSITVSGEMYALVILD